MKVSFHNIYKGIPNKQKIESDIINLIRKNKFIGGDVVKKFEKNFAIFTKSKFCISVGNGTDALEISLEALGIKKNSEVIVPANTWIATANAVARADMKVVFCDVNLDDYSICIDDLKKKITKKTKAIIPVHLYGHPADMMEIKKLAKAKNIKIIEDCAQAHGTKLFKKHVGNFGNIGTFSFYPGKNIGAFGDAGCIITNNKNYAKICERIRNHGALKKYDHEIIGRNSRLDTIQSSILLNRLKVYNNALKKRNVNASIYFQELKNIKDLHLPILKKDSINSYHQFVIRTNLRNNLQDFLKSKNIQTMIHYPYMLSDLKIYKKSSRIKNLKNSKNLGDKILSLPISEEHTKKEIYYVSKIVKSFFNKK
tara:strand:+ start:10709 stop:11812 length:1104 start_codon:yes stop_codon:yes gene_type:complete